MVLSEGGLWTIQDWSEDDKLLLVKKYVRYSFPSFRLSAIRIIYSSLSSVNESTIYVLNLETKALTQINPKEGTLAEGIISFFVPCADHDLAGQISYGGGCFAKGTNSQGVFFTSDEGSEFQHLRYYDLAHKAFLPHKEGGVPASLTDDIPWDVDTFTMSDQGDRIAFITNEDGISKLYALDFEVSNEGAALHVKRRDEVKIPMGQAYNLRFHPDGKQIGVSLNTPQVHILR